MLSSKNDAKKSDMCWFFTIVAREEEGDPISSSDSYIHDNFLWRRQGPFPLLKACDSRLGYLYDSKLSEPEFLNILKLQLKR
jgi:hypothetical protein